MNPLLVVTPKESIRHSVFAYFALRIDAYGMTNPKIALSLIFAHCSTSNGVGEEDVSSGK
jgi:hypothetical protein